MKSIYRLALIIPVLCAWAELSLAGLPSSTAESAARDTVHGYMTGLMSGNTAQLRKFLAPGFLKERQALLDSTTYAQLLRNSYANADFDIIESLAMNDGKVQVDTKVTLGNGEVSHIRFLIIEMDDGSYRILSED